MKPELTLERAYELALKKWEYIVNNGGNDDDLIYREIPELLGLKFECSYCELFWNLPYSAGCKGCPLRPKRKVDKDDCGCMQTNHPYNKWYCYSTKKNAQAVLDLIIKTKPI